MTLNNYYDVIFFISHRLNLLVYRLKIMFARFVDLSCVELFLFLIFMRSVRSFSNYKTYFFSKCCVSCGFECMVELVKQNWYLEADFHHSNRLNV